MDLWFTHRDLTKEMVYFNTTPTPEVRVLLLKMGYFAYSFKGEKIYHYLHIHKHKEINKLLVIPILIYMYFIRFYTHVIIRNMTSNISIELSHDIGSEIDELWRMTCNKYAYTNVRDRASIKWYAQNKELFYIKDNHQLVGYFMLFISGNTIYVTDVWGIEIEKYVKYIYSFIISKLGHKHDIRMPLYETNFNSLKGIWLPLSRPIKEKSRFLQCEDREFSKKLEKTYFTLQQGDFGV